MTGLRAGSRRVDRVERVHACLHVLGGEVSPRCPRRVDAGRRIRPVNDVAERFEAQHDVVLATAVSHQTDAPDLAGERAETGAYLELVLVEETRPDP